MKKTRMIATVLTLVLLAAIIPVPTAMAEEMPEVSLSSGTVQPDGSVTLTVSIQDNPGVAACMLYFYYDTDVFTLEPSQDISAAGSFGATGGLICNSIETAKQNGRYEGDPDKEGALALWYNGSGLNTTGDGKMMTITLRAKSDAASGDYVIGLGYSTADTCNQSSENVTLKTVGGTVTVAGGPGVPGGPKPDAPRPEDGAEKPEAVQFTDIAGHWAEGFITDAAQRGLVVGHEGRFRPDDTMTRAEFVMILWRSAGAPQPVSPASFTDLTQEWYREPVAWAEANGVVDGVGGGRFDPEGAVTREQLVTILHRLAGKPQGMEMMLTGVYDGQYPDSGEIGDWAKAALYWSIYHGIYCGENSPTVGNSLAPRAPASRGQIAVMITRYLDQKGE